MKEECPRCGGEMLLVDGRYGGRYWRCRVCDSFCGERMLLVWRGFKQLQSILLTGQDPKEPA